MTSKTAHGSGICRWGFMSTASIGRKNWQAIFHSGNGRIVAVASRNQSSAQSYIENCQSAYPFDAAPQAIEGYDALLAHPDIDAVYIPLPTGMRKDWVIKAAESGKHIMCEKPCAGTANDLAAMIDACKSNNVQFMDGVMYMHTQRLNEMKKVLDAGQIGTIRRICSQFSFNGGDEFEKGNIRTNSDLEPLGCLGDLGWYTIRFSLWAMNYEMPKTVIGRMLRGLKRDDSPAEVPMEISGELIFENGVSAGFYNSFVTGIQQWANISGTDGHLHLTDFVLPFKGNKTCFSVTNAADSAVGCDFVMNENRKEFAFEEDSDSGPSAQETNLFRTFQKIALSGKLDPHWPEIALKTQRVMDAVIRSATTNSQPIEL